MTKLCDFLASSRRSANRPRRKMRTVLAGEECEARIVPASIWWLGTAGNNWNSDSWTNVSGGAAVPGLRPGDDNSAIVFDSGQIQFNAGSTAVVNDMFGLTNLSLTIVSSSKAGPFTLSGDAISSSGGLSVSWSGSGAAPVELLQMPLTVAQNQTWKINAATEIDSVVSGPYTATLTVTGAQNLLFLGNNTFAGLMEGTQFQFGNGGTTGAPGTGVPGITYFDNSQVFVNRSDVAIFPSGNR